MKKRIFGVLLVLMSIAVSGVFLTSCDNGDKPPVTDPLHNEIAIDWTMSGTWLNRHGSDNVPIDVTIQGKILDHENSTDALELTITLPSTFQYEVVTPEPHFVSDNGVSNVLPHLYVSACYAYDRDQNSSVFCKFALDAEKEFFILVFDDTSYCLVAAQDPGVEAQTILNHFQDFLEIHCKEK